jgi:hypothetical protein
MNPVQTHLESEGIDITVDDAVDVRLRQTFPGDGTIAEFSRSLQRSIIDAIVKLAEQTQEVPE